jgi:hypothetical protein
VLYPLSYEGGGFESVSAGIGVPAVGPGPGGPGSVVDPSLRLGASLRLVYLGLIFSDKGGRYVVSLDPVEEGYALTRFDGRR